LPLPLRRQAVYDRGMKSAVLVFPGSNCDRDAAAALARVTGTPARMVWCKETALPPGLDLVVLPGGFSHGDYLRSGAMAARAPIMDAVRRFAEGGGYVLGVCNGFQTLTEAGLLPGALLKNAQGRFVCRDVAVRIENANCAFTQAYGRAGQSETHLPVAHGDGRFFAAEDALDRLEGEGQVALRYLDNPNGSARDIAGVLNSRGNVLGLMPHPERAADASLGRMGGWGIFQSLQEAA